MVHFITWTSIKLINIFKFNLCAILTKIQQTTAFKTFIYIYSAPIEGSLWLVDWREWNVQLGSADVSSFVAWRKKYNVCEQANFSIVMGGNGSYNCPSVAQLHGYLPH